MSTSESHRPYRRALIINFSINLIKQVFQSCISKMRDECDRESWFRPIIKYSLLGAERMRDNFNGLYSWLTVRLISLSCYHRSFNGFRLMFSIKVREVVLIESGWNCLSTSGENHEKFKSQNGSFKLRRGKLAHLFYFKGKFSFHDLTLMAFDCNLLLYR